MAVEQNGQVIPITIPTASATVNQAVPSEPKMLRTSLPFGKQAVPQLKAGPARIVVTATRKSFLNLRTLTTTATKDVQVRLEPPRISVVSTHHYVNHGGTEFVVYRATPSDVASGVRVGDVEYPGFPVEQCRPGREGRVLRAALRPGSPHEDRGVRARRRRQRGDRVVHRQRVREAAEEKPHRAGRQVHRPRRAGDHRALARAEAGAASGRRRHDSRVSEGQRRAAPQERGSDCGARETARRPSRLWDGPFVQLGNSKVEAAFADHRTYVYKGKEVDHQVHLGFDLAVTSHVPSSRPTPARSSTRAGSASTATA